MSSAVFVSAGFYGAYLLIEGRGLPGVLGRGAVRDLLPGLTPKYFDVATNALPEDAVTPGDNGLAFDHRDETGKSLADALEQLITSHGRPF
jgi:hypothetical protein